MNFNSRLFSLIPQLFATQILLLGASACVQTNAAHAQNIAVFDPQTQFKGRFVMAPAEMDAAAKTLLDAGLSVSRVTTSQIDDAAAFNAAKFDVLVMRGDSVPRENIPELKKFAAQGGIVVALAAGKPFTIAAAQKANGNWTYAPETPQFAWETIELSQIYGFRYRYRSALVDAGTKHQITPLGRKHLGTDGDFSGKLGSQWITTETDGGTLYPLVRSFRPDGAEVVPQIFIAAKGNARAVLAIDEAWTQDAEIGGIKWNSPATIRALVQVALDLKANELPLEGAEKLKLPSDLPAIAPLSVRVPTGEVNPDKAPVLKRWGKFDGSGSELDGQPLPKMLEPGASVTLDYAGNGQASWVRVRAAISESNAGLKIESGGQTLWNELFSYVDAGGTGNIFAADLSGVPMEFNRRVWLTPGATSVVLSNSGSKPLYFDAVQVENAPATPVKWNIGMNAGFNQARFRGPYNLPLSQMKKWDSVRAALWASNVGAPGEPDRWKGLDERMKRYAEFPVPLELSIEGTPEWAAISPQRYKNSGGRAHTVAPDPKKWAEIVEYVVKNYGDKIDAYEIWNEANSQQFYRGSPAEYVELWKTVVPIIRKGDPTAKIYSSGLAGWEEKFVDANFEAGLIEQADLFSFHPYASRVPAWDVPFGDAQGNLYARGENIEIYNNEIGFTYKPAEWFVGDFDETTQRKLTDISISRLIASGSSKISVFHGGGDDHQFSYVDENGRPRPAYAVMEDYFPLGKNGGTRWDVGLTRADGAPLKGVYVAGARHADDSITLVVNPSEVAALSEKPSVSGDEFDDKGSWKPFYGGARFENGVVTLTPEEGKPYVGLAGGKFTVNLDETPIMEVSAPAIGQRYEVGIESEAGAKENAVIREKGVARVDLREVLKASGTQTMDIKLRAFGAASFDSLRFVPADDGATAKTDDSLPIMMRVPLPKAGNWKAMVGDKSIPVLVKTANGASWAEVRLDLTRRSVVRLVP